MLHSCNKGAELVLHSLTQAPLNQIKTWPKAGIIKGTVDQVHLSVCKKQQCGAYLTRVLASAELELGKALQQGVACSTHACNGMCCQSGNGL